MSSCKKYLQILQNSKLASELRMMHIGGSILVKRLHFEVDLLPLILPTPFSAIFIVFMKVSH